MHPRSIRVVILTSVAILTIAVMAVFLVPTALASDAFSDVPDSHWAHDFISWLFYNGLTSGYPDGTYRPDNNVTRAEMAVFLQGIAGASYTLPPGETLVGSYAVAEGGSDGFPADGLIFNPPLPGDIPPSDAHFIQSAAFTTDCPGNGQAADGHLCVYEVDSFGGMTFQCFCDPFSGELAIRSFGTNFFMANFAANSWSHGNWAVTSSASLVPLDAIQTASSNSEIPGE
jgi:hypothetical protein